MRKLRLSAALLLTLLVPGLGAATFGRNPRRWLVVAIFVISGTVSAYYVKSTRRSDALRAATNPTLLLYVAIVVVALGALHAWSVVDTWDRVKEEGPARSKVAFLPLLIAALAIVPYAWVGATALDQRTTLLYLFANPATTKVVEVAANTTQLTQAPNGQQTFAPVVKPEKNLHARRTWLLLGGDAGAGRWSRRTDTIMVVSSDVETGNTVVVSIPRNLVGLPFPEGPLRTQFPTGFPGLANAVFVWGTAHPELLPGATNPGVEMLREGVEELTGWHIDNYVLVDMEGFVKVVDAIGGIDIVTDNVAPTGPLPGGGRQVGGFVSGEHRHLDGEEALAYSRSRTGSSDYARMRRQRCVVDAVAKSVFSLSVLAHLPDLQRAVRDHVTTDAAVGSFAELVTVMEHVQSGRVISLLLAPPLIKPSSWDAQMVRGLVDRAWQSAMYGSVETTSQPNVTLAAPQKGPQPSTEAMSDVCHS